MPPNSQNRVFRPFLKTSLNKHTQFVAKEEIFPHIHVCLQFVEMTTDHVSIMRYHVPIVINGSYHLNYPRHLSPKTTSGTPAAISSLTCGHLMVLKTFESTINL